MYKLNDIFYEDDEYSARADFCNNNGYMIAEIEPDDDGNRRFQIQNPPEPTEKEKLEIELDELETWFSDVYDMQMKQYDRCMRLGIEFTSKYGTAEELDTQAVEKAARIKELRSLIKSV